MDVTINHIETINEKYNVDIPLYFMVSFNTEKRIRNYIDNLKSTVYIKTFEQSTFPRLKRSNMTPMSDEAYHEYNKTCFYPPGHGEVYERLVLSGIIDELIKNGKEYIFISNIDNLGATIDIGILEYFVNSKKEFMMEVTPKTIADVKGGTIIKYENKLRLMEIAEVPEENKDEFKSIEKFKVFNTNNLWLNTNSIKSKYKDIKSPVIYNRKIVNDIEIVQLETAMGAAISNFDSTCINVSRDRFMPVKKTIDLFIVQSNLTEFDENGKLVLRNTDLLPIIEFSNEYKNLYDYSTFFKEGIPDVKYLKKLVIKGPILFGKNVSISGSVTLENKTNTICEIKEQYSDETVLFL